MKNTKSKKNIIGLKELRNNIETYIERVQKGESFTIVRRSEPVFNMSAPEEDEGAWETVVDFTKIKKGGVALKDILSRI